MTLGRQMEVEEFSASIVPRTSRGESRRPSAKKIGVECSDLWAHSRSTA